MFFFWFSWHANLSVNYLILYIWDLYIFQYWPPLLLIHQVHSSDCIAVPKKHFQWEILNGLFFHCIFVLIHQLYMYTSSTSSEICLLQISSSVINWVLGWNIFRCNNTLSCQLCLVLKNVACWTGIITLLHPSHQYFGILACCCLKRFYGNVLPKNNISQA